MKLLRIIYSDLIARFLSVGVFFSSLVLYSAWTSNYRDAILGLQFSILLLWMIKIIEITILYRKYTSLAGSFEAFSFINDHNPVSEDYNKLKNERNGIVTLTYLGGNLFHLNLVNSGDVFRWEGRLEFDSANTANIAWRYITPADMKNLAGYKRAVLFEEFTPTRIYMFSNDNQGYGREVLIKYSK